MLSSVHQDEATAAADGSLGRPEGLDCSSPSGFFETFWHDTGLNRSRSGHWRFSESGQGEAGWRTTRLTIGETAASIERKCHDEVR